MSTNKKSKWLFIRKNEFIGDAFIAYHIKRLLVARYPHLPMKDMTRHFDKFISNHTLTSFGRSKNIGNANRVEIMIGTCIQMDESVAIQLIEELFEYTIKNYKLDDLFRSKLDLPRYDFRDLGKHFNFHFNFNNTISLPLILNT